MYDLNVCVPNIASKKYSNDDKFLLLKNYLFELNETLSYALTASESGGVGYSLQDGTKKEAESDKYKKLKAETLERFSVLKSEIIRTADEITEGYTVAVEQSETGIMSEVSSGFVAKAELGEYKNDVSTSFLQTADSINLCAQKNDELKTDLEAYKSSNNTEFSVQADSIMSQVGEMFTSKNELAEFSESISSEITQTSSDITENFSSSIVKISDDLSTLGGEVAEVVSSLDVYIRRGELEENVYGVEIGRSDSGAKARFTNDKLSFYQGTTEVAYISGSNLYITRAEILDYLRVGNSEDGYFTFDGTENGLEVRWTNG